MNNPLSIIRNYSDAIAALPALLSYVPTNSLIALLCAQTSGELVMQSLFRIPVDVSALQAATIPSRVEPALRITDTVILIAICDAENDRQATANLDAVRDALTNVDIEVKARLLTRNVTTAGHWTNIDTGATGPVYPYTDSILTAEQVHRGRIIAPTRDQILAEFNQTTNPAPVIADDPGDILMDTLEEISAAITTSLPDKDNSLATRAGMLITENVHLRDSMLLLGLENTASAARLWTRLANQLTGQARIEMLTLAAANYYMSRDAVRAGIALELAGVEAEADDLTFPSLAILLDTALQSGASPDDIRGLFERNQ